MTEAIAPRREDVESIDAAIDALYDVISGPAGDRDWDRLRSLFVEGGRLIPTGERPNGTSGLEVMDVEAFVATAGAYMADNAFYERELARRVDRFGNIAHAFSTYETRHTETDADPFMRGINSIQLLHQDGRWWIVTIFWDNEGPDKPIPDEYLP
jgi:hypothetical protein